MSSPAAALLRPSHSSTSYFPSSLSRFLLLSAASISLLPGANAYSWKFRSDPKQCQNLTIDITGNDGTPPFRVLTIPFGASPLPNNVEARTITEQMFPGNQRSVSFQLKYPATSQFVTVVSDASGFGTGGTSVAAQVGSSSDSSCFDPTKNVSPQFVFSIEPPNQVVQCQEMRIWWDPATVQGIPNFLGVIPGGQSFAIPRIGDPTQVPQQGLGFSWTPNVRGGTTLMLVGGDNRGNGTAGSVLFVVNSGIDNNSTCLNESSPSSTPGSPAGGSYPTGGGGSIGGGGGNSGGSNTGAIAGGVIAGVVAIIAIILLIFFLRRRSRNKRRVKERPVDLLNEGDSEDEGDVPQIGPQRVEPFMVPDPTVASETEDHSQTAGTSSWRPTSGTSQTYSRSGTPDLLGGSQNGYGWGVVGGSTTSASRKGQQIRMRPVNIVQHEDAGPPLAAGAGKEDEPETIELPPAYTALNASFAARGATAPPNTTVTDGENANLQTAAGTATTGNRAG